MTTALDQAIENERIAAESYTEDYELAVRRQDWAAARLYKEKARLSANILAGLKEKRAAQRVEIPDSFDPLRGWYVNGWHFNWENTGGGCMCWVGEQISRLESVSTSGPLTSTGVGATRTATTTVRLDSLPTCGTASRPQSRPMRMH